MGKKIEHSFADVLQLAEAYQEQYRERGLSLSHEQNEAAFRDFVARYREGKSRGEESVPLILEAAPLF